MMTFYEFIKFGTKYKQRLRFAIMPIYMNTIIALEMKDKRYDVKLIIEGTATKLVKDLMTAPTPFIPLDEKVKAAGLIDYVCQACSKKTGSYDEATAQGLPV